MTATVARRARTPRRCDTCAAPIRPGDRYLSHVASPYHGELGNTGWWRYAECGACAERYGRGPLVVAT